MLDNITALTVNFKTPDLVYDCVNSFRRYYPSVQHIVIDNGGCEKSLKLLRKLQDKELLTLIENQENIGHGQGLNQGIALMTTDYAFLLDSDTRTKKNGFLEKMLELFEKNNRLFAAGWLRKVDRNSGVSYRGKSKKGIDYIHPYACLMDIDKFRQGRPFSGRGAPAIDIMNDAIENRYVMESFPIEGYIWHKVAGTRGMFGGRFSIRVDEIPRKWKRCKI